MIAIYNVHLILDFLANRMNKLLRKSQALTSIKIGVKGGRLHNEWNRI